MNKTVKSIMFEVLDKTMQRLRLYANDDFKSQALCFLHHGKLESVEHTIKMVNIFHNQLNNFDKDKLLSSEFEAKFLLFDYCKRHGGYYG